MKVPIAFLAGSNVVLLKQFGLVAAGVLGVAVGGIKLPGVGQRVSIAIGIAREHGKAP
jgi:hypothetical protein